MRSPSSVRISSSEMHLTGMKHILVYALVVVGCIFSTLNSGYVLLIIPNKLGETTSMIS